MAGTPKKISQFPQDTAPTVNDSIPTYDPDTSLTKRALISDLITLFFNNIPAAAATSTTLAQDTTYDFIKTGTGVWTADSAGSNRNASMSALTCYQNGQKITISAVTARTFTASKDTYIDVLNTAGVGTLVYTEVSNNAASPALAANSIRAGIIVTGASTIAAAGSVNQGQEDRILPIASSVPYCVTDSLGNLICPRDPNRKLLGYSRIAGAFTTTTVSLAADVTGLQTTYIAQAQRKVKIRFAPAFNNSGSAGTYMSAIIRESSTVLAEDTVSSVSASFNSKVVAEQTLTPSAGSHTYKASVDKNAGGTLTVNAGTGGAASWTALELYIEAE